MSQFQNIQKQYTCQDFLYKEINHRAKHLRNIPLLALEAAIRSTLGSVAVAASVVTVGTKAEVSNEAFFHLRGIEKIAPSLYFSLLGFINPHFYIRDIEDIETNSNMDLIKNKFDKALISKLQSSKSFYERHIATRLSSACFVVVCVAIRTMEFIRGMIALPISFLTLGQVEVINNYTSIGLKAPFGLVNDLFYCTMKIINPLTSYNPNNCQ